jgi:phosphoribosylformylglycinamidine cyclo-ligase
VFNMGCGFAVLVAPADADDAMALLAAHHPGARPIGRVTAAAGAVSLPGLAATLTR